MRSRSRRAAGRGGRRSLRVALLVFALLLLASLAAALARADDASPARRSYRVVYLAGASIYLDAGTTDGLASGDTLVVRHLGSEIAMIRVGDVSSRRAACDTLLVRREVQVGDEARVIGRAPRAESVAAATPPESSASEDTVGADGMDSTGAAASGAGRATSPEKYSSRLLRGRVGARWMSSSAEGAVTMRQPMLDLRLDAGNETTPFTTALDVRGRSVVRTSSVGDSHRDSEARVYRAQVRHHAPGSATSVSAGRLTSPALASVSLFDGALVEAEMGRWKAGLFGGTQPEPQRMGWSSRIVEYGGYAEIHPREFLERRWQLGAGAVSSMDDGQINRDFVFAQGFYRDARFSGSWLQEADAYRGVRREPGKPGFSFTSTFLNAQARITKSLILQSGYDNRRNVRLWRDRLTPETEFDDRYRQGVWSGMTVRGGNFATLSGSQRWNQGAGDRSTVSSVYGDMVTRRWRMLAVRGRWSQYHSDLSRTSLFAGSLGVEPLPGTHLECSAGRRQSTVTGLEPDAPVRWWGLNGDFAFGRRWFGDVSFERSNGDLERSSQVYAGLSRRL